MVRKRRARNSSFRSRPLPRSMRCWRSNSMNWRRPTRASPEVMGHRWAAFNKVFGYTDLVFEETDRLLERESTDEKLAGEAHYARARASIVDKKIDDKRRWELIDLALKSLQDDRTGNALLTYATDFVDDLKRRTELARRAARFPKGSRTERQAQGILKRLARLGTELELAFEDALTGRKVDLHDLRGKPILIHVWAMSGDEPAKALARWRAMHREFGAGRAHLIGVHQIQSRRRRRRVSSLVDQQQDRLAPILRRPRVDG